MTIEEFLTQLLAYQVKRTYFRLGTIDTDDGMKPLIELRNPAGEFRNFIVEGDRLTEYDLYGEVADGK